MKTLLIQIDISPEKYNNIETRTTATQSIIKERNEIVKENSVIFNGGAAQRFGWDYTFDTEPETEHKSPCFEIKHSENIYWKTKNKEKFTLRDVFRLQTFSEDFDVSNCSFEMIKCATPVELGNLVISLINH